MAKISFYLFFMFNSILMIGQPTIGRKYHIDFDTNKYGSIKNIFLDLDNNLWYHTTLGLVIKNGTVYREYSSSSQNKIFSFLDNGNNIYIGQHPYKSRITQYNKKKSTIETYDLNTNLQEGKSHPKVNYFLGKRKELFQIGQIDTTVILTNIISKKSKNYKIKSKISSFRYSERYQGLLILTDAGYIFLLQDNGKLQLLDTLTLKKENSPTHWSILIEGIDGTIWVKHKSDNNLFYFNPLKNESVRKYAKFKNGKIIDIWTDHSNNIIVYFLKNKDTNGTFYINSSVKTFTKWDYLNKNVSKPERIIGNNFLKEILVYNKLEMQKISFPPDFVKNYNHIPNLVNQMDGNSVSGLTKFNDSILIYSTNNEPISFFNINTKVTSPLNIQFPNWKSEIHYEPSNNKMIIRYINSQSPIFKLLIYDFSNKTLTPLFTQSFTVYQKKTNQDYFIINDDKLYLSKSFVPDYCEIATLGSSDLYCNSYDSITNQFYYYSIKVGFRKIDLNNQNKIKLIESINESNIRINRIEIISKNEYRLLTNHGVLVLDTESDKIIERLGYEDGLSNHIVTALAVDSFENHWYSTHLGINFYSNLTKSFFQIKTLDGTIANKFNSGSSIIMNDRFLYFGSSNGLVEIDLFKYYNPNKNNEFKIEVEEYNVLDHNNTIKKTNLINSVFDIDQGNSMNLVLTNSKLVGNSITYYFKVNDGSYTTYSDEKFQNLSNLKPGDYNISVIGFDRFGISSSNSINFILKIHRSLQNLYIIYLSIILSIILLVLMISLSRNKRQKKKMQLKYNLLEFELSALQSQLNPHFISNSMLAINNFIKNNNAIVAEKYLLDFSRVMRLFLESSKKKTIPLRDEIDLLSYYSNLEQLRFKHSFDIKIDIDDNIDIDLLELPSMMIQPFVENAINHGLYNKTNGQGLLEIKVSEYLDDQILFIIQDNGSGFIKKKSSHISRSSQIITEKINILKSVSNIEISIKIVDLAKLDPSTTGTRIEIIFPEIY